MQANNRNPLVNVIIPTYNSAAYLVSTINSVLDQSYQPMEVIVVDDGSTDNTSDLIKPLLREIKYVRKENGGASSARNLGIRLSKGEYIAFLDSDDLWRREKITKQIECFNVHQNLGLVYCDSSTFDEKGTIHKSIKRHVETPTGNVLKDMIVHNFLNNSTVMIKRSCFEKVGLWNERLVNGNDYEMWLRVSAFYEFGFVDQVLVDTRYHSHGLSSLTDLQCENSIKIQEEFIKRFGRELNIPSRVIKKGYSYKYTVWGQRLFYQGKHPEARRKFIKALSYEKRNVTALIYLLKSMAPNPLIRIWRAVSKSRVHSYH